MRKSSAFKITLWVLCTVLVLGIGLGTWNALRPIPPALAVMSTLPSAEGSVSLSWPSVGEAAIAAAGHGVLASHGEAKALPTASIAKVITSLAVLQKSPLQPGDTGPTYTVTADDVARYNDYVAKDGSVVAVQAGEQITEYQALQALMLPSANNIADSLTVWVFGSFASYQAYATQMLTTLDMKDTVIGSDASGLAPNTVSTPQDLIKLGTAALANPVLTQIVGQTSAVLPVAGTVHNVNGLLGSHGVVGIKTGNSDEAGGCLLFASKQQVGGQDITLVGAVMGTQDLYSAIANSGPLIDSAIANFASVAPIHAGQTIATYTLPWGGTATATAKNDISFVKWNGDGFQTKATAQSFSHTLGSNAELGTATVTSGTQTYKTTLVTKTAVPGPSLWWRITRKP